MPSAEASPSASRIAVCSRELAACLRLGRDRSLRSLSRLGRLALGGVPTLEEIRDHERRDKEERE